MNEKAIAIQMPDQGTWTMMKEQAGMLVTTGFLPDSIKKPEQAVAIMLKGRELGLPPMQALNSITVIKGKPTCSAELLQALIYRDHGDNALRFVEATNERATLEYRRRNWAKPERFSFSMQDAQAAGLTSNPTWKSYPGAMLRARCISAVARMAFADSIGGMYTPEELGAVVTVNADTDAVEVIDQQTGEILEVEARPAPVPVAKPKPVRTKAAAEPEITDEVFREYAKANGITSTALYLDVVGVPVPQEPGEAYRLLKERLDAIAAEQAEQEEMFDLPVDADPDRHTA